MNARMDSPQRVSTVTVLLACLAFQFTSAPLVANTDATGPALGKHISETEAKKSTLRKLEKELSRLDPYDLTERIEQLEVICQIADDPESSYHSQLQQLRQTKENASATLDQAGDPQLAIAEAISLWQPFAGYFTTDAELRRELRYSMFANRLTLAIRDAAQQAEWTRLEELKRSVKQSGLEEALPHLYSEAVKTGTRSLIAERLESGKERSATETEFAFILSKLFGEDAAPLEFHVLLHGAADDELKDAVAKALHRKWAHRVNLAVVSELSELQFDKVDALAIIELSDLTTDEVIKESVERSLVPGRVVKKENPDFVKALKLYEDADKHYREELEWYYEYDYAEYREDYEEAKNEALRLREYRLGNIDSPLAAHGENSDDFEAQTRDMTGGELLAAEMEAKEHLRRLNRDKVPEMPEPPHERLFKKLQETPSTIVVKEEDMPYQYTSRTIVSTFHANADLTIIDRLTAAPIAKDTVTLRHTGKWLQNVGVNPRDPGIPQGNYSPELVASEQNLFALEFSASCSKSIQSLLDESAETLLSRSIGEMQKRKTVFALALRLGFLDRSAAELSADELLEFAANVANVAAPEDSQALLLAFAARKVGWSEELPNNRLSELLRMNQSQPTPSKLTPQSIAPYL